MGIFIPNVDIPEYCAMCLRFNGAFNYCYEIKKHIQKPWERHAECPLIEITNEVVTEWLSQCANVKKGERYETD